MYIKSITLRNFKNYEEASFDFSQQGSLIIGQNGIGKSNLLEAISYFTYGRSIVGLADSLLINYSATSSDSFFIKSLFCINDCDTEFKAYYKKDHKVIHIDGQPLRKISDLYQYLQVVYSSPDDIFNIFSTPTKRRQFLDMAISKGFGAYIDYIRRFRLTLSQRNALLSANFTIKEKEAWDSTFCTDAMNVVEYRQQFFKVYKDFLIKAYQMIISENEEIDIIYKPNFATAGDFIAQMMTLLRENLPKEKKYQTSMIGPQRDDFYLTINGKNALYSASQGQKRSIVIAMKLALAEMITSIINVKPILIFDDTLAELDHSRSTTLLANLTEKHQIFIASPTLDRYATVDLPILSL